MNTPQFPDENIERFIEDLSREFSLNVQGVSFTSNDGLSELSRGDGDEKWLWSLKRTGSSVQIGISFLYPSYVLVISFENLDPNIKNMLSTSFFFEEYLSKHVKAYGDAETINQINKDKSWKDNWKVQLEILKTHLRGDLGRVIEGKEWPNIEFNLEDYISPEGMDRLYEDQLKLIESSISKKENEKGWLYFLNFKKKK